MGSLNGRCVVVVGSLLGHCSVVVGSGLRRCCVVVDTSEPNNGPATTPIRLNNLPSRCCVVVGALVCHRWVVVQPLWGRVYQQRLNKDPTNTHRRPGFDQTTTQQRPNNDTVTGCAADGSLLGRSWVVAGSLLADDGSFRVVAGFWSSRCCIAAGS